MGAVAQVALCSRCRHETLPQLAQPSWHREKHRATRAEREPAPDPRAEKIKRRKEARRVAGNLRKQIRVKGLIAATKFFLSLKARPATPLPPPSDDCPTCLDLQR
jgi:hypothetical protein